MSGEQIKNEPRDPEDSKRPQLPLQLRPDLKPISKNCLNFNRLFHCSFDEDSADEPKVKVECGVETGRTKDVHDDLKIDVEDVKLFKAEPQTPESSSSIVPSDPEEETIPKSPDGEGDGDSESSSSGSTTNQNRIPARKRKRKRSIDHSDVDVYADEEEIEPVKRKSSRRTTQQSSFCTKTHEALIMKRLTRIFKQDPSTLTPEEKEIISSFPVLARIVKKRLESRLLASERLKEFEDPPDILETKCQELASTIRNANHLIIYSGAGISTSASIPDYRGPNGIWTLLRNGQSLDSKDPVVLTTADPTLTHMSIKKLYDSGIVKHIVSQNCDGLHLRSGIPKNALSEVHGNMYIEGCIKCGREYVRLFDVTENTRRHEHRTGRRCYYCATQLRDTVIHFGERGAWRFPLNWQGAEYAANHADVILCIGSSLKVLRRYPWLWCMDQPANKRPKLVIVNLQWTPKDSFAALKIHGKCDQVMCRVMEILNLEIPKYSRALDPIFAIATPLHSKEMHLKSSRELTFPEDHPFPSKLLDLNNYIQFEPEFRVVVNTTSEDEDDSDDEEESSENPESPQKLKLRSSTKKHTKKLSEDQTSTKNAKSSTNSKLTTKTKNRDSEKKLKNKSIIKKGNGNGWLGNAWGRGTKPKKRKLK